MTNYVVWTLLCHGCGYSIRIPRPNLIGTIEDRMAMPKTDVQANFVCPECDLVSAYEDCGRDIVPIQDPFEGGLWSLAYIEVECD